MREQIMLAGILYALLAGLMWGLVFAVPLLLPDYPAPLQSVGRYLAFGLIALPIAWLDRANLRELSVKTGSRRCNWPPLAICSITSVWLAPSSGWAPP